MHARELPPDYPLHHARMSVGRAMEMEGHLLTRGEWSVVQRWLTLSDDAAHVHSRLYGRKTQPVRLDGFEPPLLGSLQAAIDELDRTGMIDLNPSIPFSEQLKVWRLTELRDECRRNGIPSLGKKAVLVSSLLEIPKPLPSASVAVVRIRNQRLFQRIHRTYLHDHRGDLTKIVLSDMGIRKPVNYGTTAGTGRYKNRRALREYEAAKDRAIVPECTQSALQQARDGLQSLNELSPPTDSEWRFSGHRFRHLQVQQAATQLERSKSYTAASSLYSELLTQQPRKPWHIVQRLALCLDRMGDPKNGAALCLAHHTDGAEGYPLIRTGRRLARRCGIEWAGQQLPADPPSQTIKLPYMSTNGQWWTDVGARRIEDAVVRFLTQQSRTAFRSENGLWSTVFGLLFADIMFAPVDGMLPTPFLNKPLDLDTEGFRGRRSGLISSALEEIEQGHASRRIIANYHRFQGQNIAGVSWNRFPLRRICNVCGHMPPTGLAFIMNRFIDGWSSAAKGMPDLVILPSATPPANDFVPKEMLLVEIKGPNDTLRDHQRWWIHKLNQQGIPTQVWHIQSCAG